MQNAVKMPERPLRALLLLLLPEEDFERRTTGQEVELWQGSEMHAQRSDIFHPLVKHGDWFVF